jgi:hypothetical protein
MYVGLASGCLTALTPRIGSAPTPSTPEPEPPPPTRAPASSPPSPYHINTIEPLPRVEPPPAPPVEPIRLPAAEIQNTAVQTESPRAVPVPGPTERVALIPPPDEPLVEALRRLLQGRPAEEAEEALRRCDKADPKLMLELLRTVTLCREIGRGDADLEAALQQLAADLRARAPLSLGAVCFCSEIKAFGVYKPLAAEPQRARFRSGGDLPGEPMQLYIEVRDFYNRPLNGAYETRLSARVEIRDERGKTLAEHHIRPRIERSLSPLHDYSFPLIIPVPAHLPLGYYTLRLDVCDETPPPPDRPLMPRVAHRELSFEVVAQPAHVADERSPGP